MSNDQSCSQHDRNIHQFCTTLIKTVHGSSLHQRENKCEISREHLERKVEGISTNSEEEWPHPVWGMCALHINNSFRNKLMLIFR